MRSVHHVPPQTPLVERYIVDHVNNVQRIITRDRELQSTQNEATERIIVIEVKKSACNAAQDNNVLNDFCRELCHQKEKRAQKESIYLQVATAQKLYSIVHILFGMTLSSWPLFFLNADFGLSCIVLFSILMLLSSVWIEIIWFYHYGPDPHYACIPFA